MTLRYKPHGSAIGGWTTRRGNSVVTEVRYTRWKIEPAGGHDLRTSEEVGMAAETTAPPPSPIAPRIALLLAALALLAWHARPDGRLHLLLPAVPGDAALLRTPRGDFVLIDGGADPAALAATLGKRLPFWQRDLRAVLLTSADPQRLPGQVAALERYRSTAALAPPGSPRGATFAEWRSLLAAQGTPTHTLRRGMQLDLSGATLTVLAADDAGVVLRLQYGRSCAILAHAMRPAAEKRLAPPEPPCDLLVIPWERDPRSQWVERLRPRAILFSDGERGDDGVELTYAERAVGGARLHHERVDGAVEWVSDGTRSWVVTER
jgi:competence protein ComEC